MASHTRSKSTPWRAALLTASVPASEKATMSIPLSASFRAMSSFMRSPQVVVDTAQPALRASAAMSKKPECSSGSPQPCRCTRLALRISGHSRSKVPMSMSRASHWSRRVVWGQ